jgi:uncharacterized protein (TIGR03067 family)
MRWPIVFLALAAGLLTAADNPSEEAAKKDLEQLQGAWTPTAITVDGKDVPAENVKDAKFTIKGNRYSFQHGSDTIEGTFKLDPAKKPRAIDATRTSEPDKGKTLRGIYEVDKDDLKMCFNGPDKEERPRDFASKEGRGHRYYIFKRAAP